MLNNVTQIPKINGHFLSPILTTLGLKQGDNLSPILFLRCMMLKRYLMRTVILCHYLMICPLTLFRPEGGL